jgi:hypothetical protein
MELQDFHFQTYFRMAYSQLAHWRIMCSAVRVRRPF